MNDIYVNMKALVDSSQRTCETIDYEIEELSLKTVEPDESTLSSYRLGLLDGEKRAALVLRKTISDGLDNREIDVLNLSHAREPEEDELALFTEFRDDVVILLGKYIDLVNTSIEVVISKSFYALDEDSITDVSDKQAYEVGQAQGFIKYVEKEIEYLNS